MSSSTFVSNKRRVVSARRYGADALVLLVRPDPLVRKKAEEGIKQYYVRFTVTSTTSIDDTFINLLER